MLLGMGQIVHCGIWFCQSTMLKLYRNTGMEASQNDNDGEVSWTSYFIFNPKKTYANSEKFAKKDKTWIKNFLYLIKKIKKKYLHCINKTVKCLTYLDC